MSKLKTRQPLEKEIQKSILEWLQWNKVFCWKQNNAGIYKPDTGQYIPSGKRGISDIIGVINGGKFLAIEVKRKGAKSSEVQQEFLDRVTKEGGVAFCADSLDAVINNLKDYIL